MNTEKILIECIFRPNDASDEGNKQINKVFAKITDRIKRGEFSGLMLTGDFNYGDIEWDELLQGNVSSNCSKHKEFLESVENSGLFQNVFNLIF